MIQKGKKSYPAIMHVDADAFFASCEQALYPEFQNRPVIVGEDRGIAVALSYEAKRAGVTRGMLIQDVKRICPDGIILSGDDETYALFSRKIFSILIRFSNEVEQYSIDEGFVNITGMDKVLNLSYNDIGKHIRGTILKEIGISVSVGIGKTKTLAKLASYLAKPARVVEITEANILESLSGAKIGNVWGIGSSSAHYMNQLGIYTADALYSKNMSFVAKHFTKPHQEIWHEMHGNMVYPICIDEKTQYASISQTRTFGKTFGNKALIYQELISNLEGACRKARKYGLLAGKVTIMLKRQDFSHDVYELRLPRPSSFPAQIAPLLRPLFDGLYEKRAPYRGTGIILSQLQDEKVVQLNLLENESHFNKLEHVYNAVDTLLSRYGKNTISIASSHNAMKKNQQTPQRIMKLPLLVGVCH